MSSRATRAGICSAHASEPEAKLAKTHFLIEIRTENPVPERKNHAEIAVVMPLVRAMVQMVDVGAEQNQPEPTRISHRNGRVVQVHREHVRQKTDSEPKHRHDLCIVRKYRVKNPEPEPRGGASRAIEENRLERVLAKRREHREAFGGMVDRMKLPERAPGMERAMRHVAREVEREHRDNRCTRSFDERIKCQRRLPAESFEPCARNGEQREKREGFDGGGGASPHREMKEREAQVSE